jgi:hypothetical protein
MDGIKVLMAKSYVDNLSESNRSAAARSTNEPAPMRRPNHSSVFRIREGIPVMYGSLVSTGGLNRSQLPHAPQASWAAGSSV